MTSRERLLTVLRGEIPDCVPVAPDFSNMIPARMTGKPFWDIYLYNDPPTWEAYIDCAKLFNIDSLMDGYFPLSLPDEAPPGPEWETFIVFRSEERIVTQASCIDGGKRAWAPTVTVYYIADPPTAGIDPAKIRLPHVPKRWEPVEGVKPVDTGPEGLKRVKELLGDQGLVGIRLSGTKMLHNEQDVYRYYDNPDKHEEWAERHLEASERAFERIMALDVKPDFLAVGGSGTLVTQTVEIFRKLALPGVKRVIELATAAGIPTQVHSCGPEKALVKIMAEETSLTVIDPLEEVPMGDCDLAELKALYGDRLVLKGNLHTTRTMLHGSADDVARASKRAIDDAAAGGRFILSTGDQCGRDTPDENLHAMIETARTYGQYRSDGRVVGDG
ncbi:MAG: uroporphyrinogen decarboxylase family protein [Planctomycetia bacterium]|nr:uroporphyrinogen decarboxylase family protein [Planctomycetia bacterium]